MATHASNPEVTVSDVVADCEVAKNLYNYTRPCFTWVTVQFLLDEIAELEKRLSDAAWVGVK